MVTKLYEDLTSSSGAIYLSSSDLPTNICGLDIDLSESLHGTLSRTESEEPFYTLEEAMENINSKECMSLFTMGSSVPGYACSILKSEEFLYFFDPHSRDNTGIAAANGLACISRGGDIIHPLLESVQWCEPIGHRHALTCIHTTYSPAHI